MLIGIIGAMHTEVAELLKNLKNTKIMTLSMIDFYHGSIEGYDVLVSVCGPGKVNAAVCTQLMISNFQPACILNVGVAGSLSKDLAIGEFALASSVVQYDVDTTIVGDPIGLISRLNKISFDSAPWLVSTLSQVLSDLGNVNYRTGLIATGDKFFKSSREKLAVLQNFPAIACDMESGSIGHVCYMNNVDFGIFRCISDNADSSSGQDYAKFLQFAVHRVFVATVSSIVAINNVVNSSGGDLDAQV